MTVAELRKALEGLPDDMLVVQSGDAEGNSVRKTYEVDRGMAVVREDDWEVDGVHPDDIGPGKEYEESDLTEILTLWPVN